MYADDVTVVIYKDQHLQRGGEVLKDNKVVGGSRINKDITVALQLSLFNLCDCIKIIVVYSSCPNGC